MANGPVKFGPARVPTPQVTVIRLMLKDEIWEATEGSVYMPTPCSDSPPVDAACAVIAVSPTGAMTRPAAPRVAERRACLLEMGMRVMASTPTEACPRSASRGRRMSRPHYVG